MKTKSIKKTLSVLICVAVACMAFTISSCTKGSMLKSAVEQQQKKLPQKVNDNITYESLTLNDVGLVQRFEIKERTDSEIVKMSAKSEKMKGQLLVDPSIRPLGELLIGEEKNMIVRYVGVESKDSFDIVLTSNDLKKAYNKE